MAKALHEMLFEKARIKREVMSSSMIVMNINERKFKQPANITLSGETTIMSTGRSPTYAWQRAFAMSKRDVPSHKPSDKRMLERTRSWKVSSV